MDIIDMVRACPGKRRCFPSEVTKGNESFFQDFPVVMAASPKPAMPIVDGLKGLSPISRQILEEALVAASSLPRNIDVTRTSRQVYDRPYSAVPYFHLNTVQACPGESH